ncbi:MAG TPA: 4'-phosphopantetheinyl transferase superfamily protein [Acidimicrobiales bacterium]
MNDLAAALARLTDRTGVTLAWARVAGDGPRAASAAGARAARDALAAAGCAGGEVQGHADDGRPLWPAGFTGSISHTDVAAVAAAVACGATVGAVGVDVERSGALPAGDAVAVLGEQERALVRAHARPDWLATVLWSAKESAFKAWSSATVGNLGRVDPVDITVELDERTASLVVRAHGALGSATAAVGDASGAYTEVDGYIVTLVVVPRSAPG